MEVSHLNFSYERLKVINDLTLKVPEKKIVSVVGKRLSGKSTLFKIISGRESVQSGKMTCLGQDITECSFGELFGRDVFCVDRYNGLFLGLTVRENILLGAWKVKNKSLVKKDFADVLELAPYVGKYLDFNSAKLSSGEKMIVTIAMAVVSKPKLVVIDEPTFGFYPVFTERILDLLDKANKEFGITFLLMQREIDTAVKISDWLYQLDGGEIVKQGDKKSFQKFDVKC